MRFVAIDVETANSNMASICSIGIAAFEGGELVDEWYSLIDPEDYFDPVNISIHGIRDGDVMGAPNFLQAWGEINRHIGGQTVVTHTHFDRTAMHRASISWKTSELACTWLDTARVARRTWEECSQSGYGLANVCKLIGYEFEHHNALEDAKASGRILLAAMAKSELDLDAMLVRVAHPIDLSPGGTGSVRRDGNPDGPLSGEMVVFTGALAIPRREAADLAASVGCSVSNSVTKQTTLLVVGDVDVQRLAGHPKSSKHRSAEKLAASGQALRIIGESDFKELVALT